MKRSRIFLGITTALLAVAGLAAAKTYRHPTAVRLYYFNAAGTKCTLAGRLDKATSIFANSPTGQILVTLEGTSKALYTNPGVNTIGAPCHVAYGNAN